MTVNRETLEAESDVILAVHSGYEVESFLRDTGGTWTDRIQFLMNQYKAQAQLRLEEEGLLEKQREEREEKKEAERAKGADDMLDNMSEEEYLKTETEFAGLKMTGKQWRDFAKRNREHREESDAYARRMGATEDGITKSNAALDAMEVAPANRTDAQKDAIREAQQDPEAREAIGIKKQWFDELERGLGADVKSSQVTKINVEARSDAVTGISDDNGIYTPVQLKRDFSATASPDSAALAQDNNNTTTLVQKPEPVPVVGGMDLG